MKSLKWANFSSKFIKVKSTEIRILTFQDTKQMYWFLDKKIIQFNYCKVFYYNFIELL